MARSLCSSFRGLGPRLPPPSSPGQTREQVCQEERSPVSLRLRSSISALAMGSTAGRLLRQAPVRGVEVRGCSERSGDLPSLHSSALTNLNLTGGYVSAGVVPDVGLGWKVPGGSQRPSSELGGDGLAPPSSTGLVRLDEEEAGLPRLSAASAGSALRLGTSERSGIRSDEDCTYQSAQFLSSLWPLGSIMVLSPFPTLRLPLQPSPSTLAHYAAVLFIHDIHSRQPGPR